MLKFNADTLRALHDVQEPVIRTEKHPRSGVVIWVVVADANRYFAGQAPWALAKTDPVRQGTVLYVTAEVLRQIAILAQPFMPESAARLLDLLGVPTAERNFSFLGGAYRVAAGAEVPTPAPVFPRYVEPVAPAAH